MITDSPLIYLDHAATTPTDLRVVEAMLPYFSITYGNPSSGHRIGQQAAHAVHNSRRTIATRLNCAPADVIFTSGASESDNLALRGFVQSAIRRGARPHVFTSAVEHHAISHTARDLSEHDQCEVTWLPVDRFGAISPDTLRSALASVAPIGAPILVSLMLANNEVGTVQPIETLAAIAHDYGAVFHTDAAQAVGQIPIDVEQSGVDLLTLSGHKFYGPKGVGALIVRNGVSISPLQSGGGQEHDRRAGTENVPLIVGLATALDLAMAEFDQRVAHYIGLCDRLIDGVLNQVSGAVLTGDPVNRLPNHASFVIDGIESNALLMHLDMQGIAASSGSACNTGSPEPSDVLLAMGYSPELAMGSLRLTIGKGTTAPEIDQLLAVLPRAVAKLRRIQSSLR